jgi:hypothetical protein
MIEPVTATLTAIYALDRACDRVSRARQRQRLMRLAGSPLPPGTEVGERYGRDAGWYIKAPLLPVPVGEGGR